jgi:peptidoglycan/xylan/chitin deacetylase (PgdA/CDA1 family)
MLRNAKRAALKAAKAAGLFRLSANRFRDRRLLILCYHGISSGDEHRWNPGLYMDLETFRARMRMLRDGGYRVLPLGEALERLYHNALPKRSVVLTFDDGSHDFYTKAWPVLQEFQFPATVYLSTFYCRYQAPVFDSACAYMLWKREGKTFDATGFVEAGGEVGIGRGRWRDVYVRVYRHIRQRGLSAEQKEELLETLACRLGFDLTGLREQRLFYYMTPEEVARIARDGIDVQLHTHRHRTPRDRALFTREIEDNRRAIREIIGEPSKLTHFCYPSGDTAPEFLPWLRELGIESATTCEPGLAEYRTNSLELPRLLDMPSLLPVEFEGWLTGFSEILPRRDWKADQIKPFRV